MINFSEITTEALREILELAPNYCIESYSGTAYSISNDNSNALESKSVEIAFVPFDHPVLPRGLSIRDKLSTSVLTKIEDIGAIKIVENSVELSIKDCSKIHSIKMTDKSAAESFATLLSGYYRLMVNWYYDLCYPLRSPFLEFLNVEKCHGPISNECARSILAKFESYPGYYIIRQSCNQFNEFYIDMIVDK